MKDYQNQVHQMVGIIDRDKRNLAEKLVSAEFCISADDIASAANQIAELEGRLHILRVLAQAQLNESPESAIQRILLRQSLRSPDDTWSGRGNDVRRAFADGIRAAIDDALWDL